MSLWSQTCIDYRRRRCSWPRGMPRRPWGRPAAGEAWRLAAGPHTKVVPSSARRTAPVRRQRSRCRCQCRRSDRAASDRTSPIPSLSRGRTDSWRWTLPTGSSLVPAACCCCCCRSLMPPAMLSNKHIKSTRIVQVITVMTCTLSLHHSLLLGLGRLCKSPIVR